MTHLTRIHNGRESEIETKTKKVLRTGDFKVLGRPRLFQTHRPGDLSEDNIPTC